MNLAEYQKKLGARFTRPPICVAASDKVGARALPHKCPECGNTFMARPRVMLKHRTLGTCIDCVPVKADVTEQDFLENLRRAVEVTTCLSYKQYTTRGRFGCLLCGEEWTDRPQDMLFGTPHNCKGSRKNNLKYAGPRTVHHSLANTVFTVYANEVVGLRYLASKNAISKIKTALTHTIDPVAYTYKGERIFWPAMQVSSTVYLVVDAHTLIEMLSEFKARARGCKGEKKVLSLLVRKGAGSVVELPRDWDRLSAPEIERQIERLYRPSLRVLGLDPGTTNFGWSVIEVSDRLGVKVLGVGLVKNTIKGLTGNLEQDYRAFKDEIYSLLMEQRPNVIVAERFMSRGMKGTTIEAVNIMIGGLMSISQEEGPDDTRLVTAAQWKNELNKVVNLETVYQTCKPLTAHECDSMMIALYRASLVFGHLPFEKMSQKVVNSIAKQVKALRS